MTVYAVRIFESAEVFEAATEEAAWVKARDIICGYDWHAEEFAAGDPEIEFTLLRMPDGTPVGHIDFHRADDLGTHVGDDAQKVEVET